MAKHALKPVRSTHSRLKLAVPMIVAGSLLSSAAAAYATPGPLQAPAPAPAAAPAATSFVPASTVTVAPEISASETAQLTFERPAVASTAAPKPKPAPAPAASQEKPATPAAPAATAQTAAPATPATPADTTVNDVAAAAVGATNPANIPGAAGASASVSIAATAGTGATDAFGQKIVAAAIAQANSNVQQDCTMLVTNSLRSVGISFHDWPAGYLSLGSTTTNPQPGDLIYYKNGGGAEGLAHIAVFIGNGLAVHGGFDGHNTKIFSVNVGSGPIYIHVKR